MTGELKPCALCESDKAHVDEAWSGWFVECDGCQMQAGGVSTKQHAITAWNTRPREAELEAEVERLREGVRRALTYMDPMSPGHSSHKMADARRVLQTAISHPKGADE